MTCVDHACRALLAVVFLLAVVGKAHSRTAFKTFAAGLADFSWLPASARRALAMATLLIETTASVLLAVAAPRLGALLALALLAVFTAATVQAGRTESCQCFGASNAPGGGGMSTFLTRNALLATAALIVGTLPTGSLSPAKEVTALITGAGAGALITRWDDLRYLFRPRAGTQ